MNPLLALTKYFSRNFQLLEANFGILNIYQSYGEIFLMKGLNYLNHCGEKIVVLPAIKKWY